ncbi:P-loop containing nucleoside triphosphate hydrolase protein [Suillus lakei]|nr:P-loop containing nucleoside triphosphate hydrolase protein [Suillus lakei]
MNIVIFGETGAGKSSVINLMAGQPIAHISPDSHRCTLHWTEYPITFKNGTRYQVFDTVGLEEPRLQTGEYLSAISNAHGLINTLKERGGVNLLLFCVRGGRVTATMQSNYRLFFEFLCEERVPLALVVTNLEREARMEDWYTRNRGHLEKYNIRSAGHACITAANLLDGRHRDKYEESRGILCSVVGAHCNASMEGWTGGQGWFTSSISKLVEFVAGRPKKTDIIGVLTKRCGMTKEVAQQVAQQIRGKNLSQTMIENHGNTSVPSDVRNTGLQQEYQSRPRNVVLLGESGVGKSSLINLIMGRDVAETSPDALSCTTTHASYDVTISGQCFRLWDTAGLNEGSEGRVPAAAAAKRLTLFLGSLNKGDGAHLLMYCVRGARATKALRTNYQTFSSAVGDSKVPIVIVATCLEDWRPVMTEWWNQNKDQLATYGMYFSGYACVTTLLDGLAESQDLRQRRAQSYEDVCNLILDHCSQTPHKT